MQGVTLLVAGAASALVLFIRPVYGLLIYVAALAWYPQYLSVPIGTVDFTVRRIVILALFCKLFVLTDMPKRFKWILLDKLVIVYFICEIIAGLFTSQSVAQFLENRAGAIFDMAFPYFAVRLIVQERQQYLTLLKGFLIVAAPVAMMGFYECLTGENPVGFLQQYNAWKPGQAYQSLSRAGFYRAKVVFSVSIMYGLFFSMLGPVCAGIMGYVRRYRVLYWAGLVLISIGVFSSMSSGPMLAALLSVAFVVFYRWRKYWKPVVVVIIVMCLAVEIISNRHFYDVLGDFTLDSRTAWYRSRLIDVGLFQGGMSGHWLTGFGNDVDPGWHVQIDGRDHTDIVNHYLLVLSNYGLVGFLPYLAMNVEAIRRLVAAYKASVLEADRWLVWCLSASLIGLWVTFMTVSLFDQPTTIYFMLIALSGVMPAVVAGGTSRLLADSRRRLEAFGPRRVEVASTGRLL
jgi:hypothetical protein